MLFVTFFSIIASVTKRCLTAMFYDFVKISFKALAERSLKKPCLYHNAIQTAHWNYPMLFTFVEIYKMYLNHALFAFVEKNLRLNLLIPMCCLNCFVISYKYLQDFLKNILR